MTPRLPTSKKWTRLPQDYLTQVQDLVQKTYGSRVKNGEVVVSGRIYSEELILGIGYLENGRLRQANFEASVDYRPDSGPAMDALSTCLDALGTMMDVFFENERQSIDDENEGVQFPREWKSFSITSGRVFLRFSTVNTKLEAMADELLGISPDTPV